MTDSGNSQRSFVGRVLVVLAGCYLLTAAVFAAVTRGLAMDRGTESLQAQPA